MSNSCESSSYRLLGKVLQHDQNMIIIMMNDPEGINNNERSRNRYTIRSKVSKKNTILLIEFFNTFSPKLFLSEKLSLR